MKLSPRQRRLVRRATRARDLDPSEQGGELNIVPFLDIVVNVMLFLLATTTAAIAVAQVEVELPATCATGCQRPPRSLNLSVTVAEEGVFVSGEGAHLAPGCADTTSRAVVTVPRTARGQDFAGLRDCLRAVHRRFPVEDSLILTADPLVPYEDVVQAMDAARGDAHEPWFSRVRLSAGLR